MIFGHDQEQNVPEGLQADDANNYALAMQSFYPSLNGTVVFIAVSSKYYLPVLLFDDTSKF